jgi:hypothetical protein
LTTTGFTLLAFPSDLAWTIPGLQLLDTLVVDDCSIGKNFRWLKERVRTLSCRTTIEKSVKEEGYSVG